MTTGTTTGCTPCAVIIPDTGATYYFKFLLTAESPDIGFFDAYIPSSILLLKIYTSPITSISKNSAIGGGTIISDVDNSITDRGVVYGTTHNPTTGNTVTHDGNGTGTYISNLTDLIIDTTYYVRAYAINNSVVVYGEEVSFITTATAVVITKPITSVTTISAISGGDVSTFEGNQIIERGIVWNSAINPTIANNCVSSGSGVGTFNSNLTSLTTLTAYYVRAYAVSIDNNNTTDITYGNELSFSTIGLATITTNAITSIGTVSATGGGNVISEGGIPVTEKGVVFALTTNPNIDDDVVVTDGSGLGPFTSLITGLGELSTYYVRAYAINDVGISYGNEVNFKTIAKPIVSTSTMVNIKWNTATGGGNVTCDNGSFVKCRGVEFGLSSGSYTRCTVNGSGTGIYTSDLSSLQETTAYYYRAYAVNDAGRANGDECIFATIATPPPVVTTIYLSHCNANSIDIRSGIAYGDASLTITKRGVVWAGFQNPDQSSCKTVENGNFTSGFWDTTATSLNANQLYYFRSYIYTSQDDCYRYGMQLSGRTAPPVPPTLGSLSVGSITYIDAFAGSNVTCDGGANVSGRGFVWSTTTNPTISDTKFPVGSGVGTFSSTIGNFNYATTYYIRAYGTNIAGTSYSTNEVEITTLPIAPSVVTCPVYSITSYSATGCGKVCNNGGAGVSSRGFVMGTASGTYPILISAGSGDGDYYGSLGTLAANTTYYVRACATNSIGTTCGLEVSFSTPVAQLIVTSVAVIGCTSSSADVRSGIGYAGTCTISQRGVVWSTSTCPDQTCKIVTAGTTGCWDTTITSLSSSQLYYWRAYAYICEIDCYCYGNTLTFTTCAPVAPTVTTTVFTTIGETTATGGGGNVTSSGGASVTSRGTVYGTSINPTIAGSKTNDGSGTGAFSSALSGLASTATYYYRAYATNSAGTTYGTEYSFLTLTPPAYICAVARTNTSGCKVGGVLKIFKADGTFYSSRTAFPPATEWSFCDNTVDATCSYYVNYTAMGIYNSSNSPTTCSGINWNINDATYGTTVCTTCFIPNAKVCGCIY